MKKFNIISTCVIIFSFIALSSCNKEDQIQKNLWKGSGEWEIASIHSEWDDNGETGAETIKNVGSYTFKKDGTGTIKQKIENGETLTNTFHYVNTESTLTFSYNEGEIYNDGESEDFDMEWEKNEIELRQHSTGDLGWSNKTIKLKKK